MAGFGQERSFDQLRESSCVMTCQPVMVALPDDGSFAASTLVFDSNGEGDDCFII